MSYLFTNLHWDEILLYLHMSYLFTNLPWDAVYKPSLGWCLQIFIVMLFTNLHWYAVYKPSLGCCVQTFIGMLFTNLHWDAVYKHSLGWNTIISASFDTAHRWLKLNLRMFVLRKIMYLFLWMSNCHNALSVSLEPTCTHQ